MNTRRAIWLLAAAGLLFAGCLSSGAALPSSGAVSSSPPASEASGSAAPQLVVDAAIPPVSASAVGSPAALVLDACGFNSAVPERAANGLSLQIVSGMGLLPHARDIGRYAAVGPVPELQNASPAWVVTTAGWYTIGLSDAANGIESKDPTCVVLGDDYADFTWFSTGGTRSNGVVNNPITFPSPVAKLPALLP